MKNFLVLAIVIIFISGCAKNYTAKPDPVVGMNIYTTDGKKIDGNWVYIIDDSISTAHRVIKASSHACSLHTYPIEAVDTLSISIDNAMSKLFKNYYKLLSIPNQSEIETKNLNGVIIINIDEFNPKFSCTTAPGEFYCTASTDFSLTARLIEYKNKNDRFIHASSQRSADGGDGGWCQNGSVIISESVKKAIKETLERLGEKISIAIAMKK